MTLSPITHSIYRFSWLAVFAIVLMLPTLLSGQSLGNGTAGSTYVLAFPDTTTTRNTFDPTHPNTMEDKIFVYIYSAVDNNKVTVTGNGYNRVLTAQGGKFYVLDLTDPTFRAPQPIVTETGKFSKNTFRVEAQQPVIIYCYMVTKHGAEAWTPIPVEFWGREYYAAALPGETVYDISGPVGGDRYDAKAKMAPAEILVIASQDSTLVTFAPTGKLRDSVRIDTVRLNRNEAFQIQSHVDTAATTRDQQPDIAGTHITSTKPIGVLSGNTRGMVFDDVAGLAKNSFKDMMMEWISPVEAYGQKFVYMPTMDARRPTGLPGENLSEKRTSELLRIYGRSGTKMYTLDPVVPTPTYYQVDSVRHFQEFRIGVPEGQYFEATSPAQAFMNTTAVVKFLRASGSGNFVGAEYDGWGTYAVEVVPRERWGYMAPYVAPIHPSQMEHHLNIVTDTASAKKIYWGPAGKAPTNPVLINKRIKGTDLVWGDLSVAAGQDLWITGWNATTGTQDTNAKFYGFVYGLYKGHEEFAYTNGTDLHYDEFLGVTYAYPLASSHVFLRSGDSLQIDTTNDCTDFMRVSVQAVNEKPAGLSTISLDSNTNTKIVFIDPANSWEIVASTTAQFRVVPINPLKNASAIVVITDRTGKAVRFRYDYEAEQLEVVPNNPAVLDFGQVNLNEDSPIREVTITNPLKKDVVIQNISWADGTQQFRIVDPVVPPTITLKPGQSIKIKVQIKSTVENKLYEDSLKIKLSCSEVAVKVTAETVKPCINVGDLNFGTLRPDSSVTKSLEICNNGRGYITFSNPSGLDVITWLEKRFTISDADKAKLAATVLGPWNPGTPSCVTINVTFKSSTTGFFATTARLWASTRDCRDTSVWIANVTQPSSVDDAASLSTGLTRIDPNPLHGTTRIEFSLAHATQARVEIFDLSGRSIATLVDRVMESGSHTATWNAAGIPAGVYYCRLSAGGATTTRTIVVVR